VSWTVLVVASAKGACAALVPPCPCPPARGVGSAPACPCYTERHAWHVAGIMHAGAWFGVSDGVANDSVTPRGVGGGGAQPCHVQGLALCVQCTYSTNHNACTMPCIPSHKTSQRFDGNSNCVTCASIQHVMQIVQWQLGVPISRCGCGGGDEGVWQGLLSTPV
jgi:hypothetical protein